MILSDEQSKDLKIRCLGQDRQEDEAGTCTAHSRVLCLFSNVVNAMLTSLMKEGAAPSGAWDGGYEECRSIEGGGSVQAMQMFLSLVYTGSIEDDGEEEAGPEVDIMLGCFDIAHRWNVRHVVQMLVPQLASAIHVDTLERIWETAILKQELELQSSCVSFAYNALDELRPRYFSGCFGHIVAHELREKIFADSGACQPTKKKRRTFT